VQLRPSFAMDGVRTTSGGGVNCTDVSALSGNNQTEETDERTTRGKQQKSIPQKTEETQKIKIKISVQADKRRGEPKKKRG